MKTVKYVVIRHGSNAFNQPMSSRSVLGVVEAKNKKEARETAEKKFTFYVNQRCEVICESKAKVSDWNAALESNLQP